MKHFVYGWGFILCIIIMSAFMFFVSSFDKVLADQCDAKDALIYSGAANTLINNQTNADSIKALHFTQLAMAAEKVCFQEAQNSNDEAVFALGMAHNAAIAAIAENNLDDSNAARKWALIALRFWKHIVAESSYPESIRDEAQSEIDAAEK